jgi:hypothetical protein
VAGRIERIVARTRNDAHKLIEECMLAANTCAADFLARSRHPALFRIHEGPTPERLALLPKDAVIVNTGRGELADAAAILAALDSGKLAGYATDVMEQEPPDADDPMLRHPKVLVTAHVGSRTYESVPRQAMKALNNLVNFLNGSGPVFCANGIVPSAE